MAMRCLASTAELSRIGIEHRRSAPPPAAGLGLFEARPARAGRRRVAFPNQGLS
jgi:hypothetical protein